MDKKKSEVTQILNNIGTKNKTADAGIMILEPSAVNIKLPIAATTYMDVGVAVTENAVTGNGLGTGWGGGESGVDGWRVCVGRMVVRHDGCLACVRGHDGWCGLASMAQCLNEHRLSTATSRRGMSVP